MATVIVPPGNEKRRVKVYELKNNDWFDRGTGFCTGRLATVEGAEESHIYVESEDEPDRLLLETRIGKDDGYQKQQDTLIVWTEQGGTDMALSFQEAEGCATIWNFVSSVQQQLLALGPDDGLSDDAIDAFGANPLVLPQPEIGNLEDIEQAMRNVASTPAGRDALAKFIIGEDYVRKLVPLVDIAEDLESLKDLHLLCNIMKMLILLNDSQIVDHIVNEEVVFGVIGALEYDPDFPNHKANHRKYLQDNSRYKEVVKIGDPSITKKIHATWRLTYLKDVVLARILDDPTFGVLNSLIFFNQVDIITHLQSNPAYLEELFGIIDSPSEELKRKKDAVGFIQSCCAIAKSLQAPARANLYNNFINHGLLRVISFAILNEEASLRVAGTDILVAMIDHDPGMVRAYILKSISEKKTPLTDTLIELLLVESDLGVKAQAADAIKVLLEPVQQPPQTQAQAQAQAQAQQAQGQEGKPGETMPKFRVGAITNPQIESYIQHFYEHSAEKLFKPLKDLERRETVNDLTFNDVQLFTHLIEIIMYLTRTHQIRSQHYLFTENLISRIAQLLSAPQKHLKLIALKFFRSCISLQDEAYSNHFTQRDHLAPILDIVYTTMHRDNLLNSACLELFEYIRHTTVKPLIEHLVEHHRARLEEITYVDTFQNLIMKYEQLRHPPPPTSDMTLFSNDGESEKRREVLNGNRWVGMREMDSAEQKYFESSDDEEVDDDDVDEEREATAAPHQIKRIKMSGPSPITNGLAPSPILRSLVDYPDDEDDNAGEAEDEEDDDDLESLAHGTTARPSSHSGASFTAKKSKFSGGEEEQNQLSPSPILQSPPERLSEKRRREEADDEDELGKMAGSNKRRVSGPGQAQSISPKASTLHTSPSSSPSSGGGSLRRKKNFIRSGSGAFKQQQQQHDHDDNDDESGKKVSSGIVGTEPKKKGTISVGHIRMDAADLASGKSEEDIQVGKEEGDEGREMVMDGEGEADRGDG